jgi:ParB family chromosome partitioning protein
MNGKNEISTLKLVDVIPTSDNPRHIKKDDPKVKELAESIKNSGLLCPVICRPHPDKKGKYDLRAGFRRFLAHQVLGSDTILAIVREMDDKVALDVTVLENLQRENLAPLEEARGVKALMASGQDVRTIADKIGKTPQWIIRRAKLMDLSPAWLKAIENPRHHYYGFTPMKLELIARFDHQIQDNLLEDRWLERQSIAEFQRHLADFTRHLKSAAWKLDDAILVAKIGACTTCKKRSSTQPGLFDDELDPDKIRANDKCLDKLCWEQKAKAWLAQKEVELRLQHPALVRVATESIPYDQAKQFAGVLESYKYAKVKKTTPNALPAIVSHGNATGSLIWIKPNAFTERGSNRTHKEKGKPQTMDEKQEQLRKRRMALVLQRLIDLIEKTKTAPKLPIEHYLALAAAFGTVEPWDCKNRWKLADELCPSDKRLALLDRIWAGLQRGLKQSLTVYTVGEIDKHDESAAKHVALMLGQDYAELLNDAKEEIPEPKSWGKDAEKKK